MLGTSLMLGIVYWTFAYFDYQLGTLYAFRPIVVAPVVGALLGDVQTGLAIGASLELLFMGSVSIGAYVPPDATASAVLCTAYVILTGIEPAVAVGLAMPVGTLLGALENLLQPLQNWLLAFIPKFAREGASRKIMALHWAVGLVTAPIYIAAITASVYFGSDAVNWLVEVIPAFVLDGFACAANILPVMGFAMLARMILTKQLVPFYFLGFLLTAYLNVPVLGVALLAIIIAIEKLDLFNNNPEFALAVEGDDDDDF